MKAVLPRLRLVLLALCFVLSGAAAASAQNVGTVSGAIRDAQGLPVPGATVNLLNRVSQTSQNGVSDGSGRYTLANIPFGIYVLSATLDGFTPASDRQRLPDVLARCARVFALILVIVTLAESWVVNVLGIVDERAWDRLARVGRATGITLFSAFVLWELSGNYPLPGTNIYIPGFLFWVAVVYSLFGTIITHLIGRALTKLSFERQRYEADFRHHLMRVREYSEAIALERGHAVEREALQARFARVYDNFLSLLRVQKRYTWFNSGYGQAAVVFPMLVASPRYFSGAIQLGELMQISSAFGQVQESLSWFISNYSRLASWQATTLRLTTFPQTCLWGRSSSTRLRTSGSLSHSPAVKCPLRSSCVTHRKPPGQKAQAAQGSSAAR